MIMFSVPVRILYFNSVGCPLLLALTTTHPTPIWNVYLFLKCFNLVQSVEGHRICFGHWNTHQINSLSEVVIVDVCSHPL